MPLCPAGILQNPAGPYSASVGDDACIVPQTLCCRRPQAAARKGIGRTRRRTPQSAGADSSPCRGAFWVKAVCKASPARGGGCTARRSRRGALPLCPAGILQTPAGPCPASVGDDACIVPQTQQRRKPHAAGENARPTKPLQAGSNTKSGSPLPGPAGGPMQASAPTQRAPGGKDSLCDSCEPSGHLIPICGSGSESERNVFAHRSARCRRCALRRRLAIGSLGAGKPAVQSFIACLCRHTTEDRPSLIAPGFVSFADNGGLFRRFWGAPKAAAHGGCRYESNQPTPPGFFMTSPHPSKRHPSIRSPPAKIPAPQLPSKQSTAHTCHPLQ